MTLNYYCFVAELPLPFHNILHACRKLQAITLYYPSKILTIMIYYMQYIIFTFFVNIVIGIFVFKIELNILCLRLLQIDKEIWFFLCTLEI
jgi:hypothetical protein